MHTKHENFQHLLSLSSTHLHWIDIDENEKKCLLQLLESTTRDNTEQWIEIFDTCSTQWQKIYSTIPLHLETALMWNDMIKFYRNIQKLIILLQEASQRAQAESKSLVLSNKNPSSITHMYKVSLL